MSVGHELCMKNLHIVPGVMSICNLDRRAGSKVAFGDTVEAIQNQENRNPIRPSIALPHMTKRYRAIISKRMQFSENRGASETTNILPLTHKRNNHENTQNIADSSFKTFSNPT
jgi:hypothetical protein